MKTGTETGAGRYLPVQWKTQRWSEKAKPIASATDNLALAKSIADGHYAAGLCVDSDVIDKYTGQYMGTR